MKQASVSSTVQGGGKQRCVVSKPAICDRCHTAARRTRCRKVGPGELYPRRGPVWPEACLREPAPVTLHYSPGFFSLRCGFCRRAERLASAVTAPATWRSCRGRTAAVQAAAEMADFRAGTKRKTPMPNQQYPPGVGILRDATGRLALFINGQRSDRGGQGQLALLACLLDNLGRAVRYKRLVTVIGRKSDSWSTRHLLCQYMLVLREILFANKAPFVIATVQDVGYALCEIAENPRHTSRNRRSNGVFAFGENRATLAHRGRVNSNCRCEAMWHEPLLSQPFGKRPPQPHTCYPRTPGENS
jgi:hypothetical protein